MKNLLLTALLLCGAFFYNPLAAQDFNPCPQGGELLDGMCTMSAPLKNKIKYSINAPDNRFYHIYGFGDTQQEAMESTQSTVADVLIQGRNIVTGTFPVGSGFNCSVTYSNYRWEISGYGTNGLSYGLVWRYDRLYTLVPGQSTSYPNGNCPAGSNPGTTTTRLETQASISGNFTSESAYQCPPDGSVGAAFTQGPYVTESGQNLCFYMADEANSCPTNSGGNPQFHFGPVDKDKECIVNDNGSLCPWINQGGGVFVPDYANPGSCGPDDEITDPEIPEPDPDDINSCTTLSGGAKACPANPSDKCQLDGDGKMTCEPGCGFITSGGQTEFFCINESEVEGPGDGDGEGDGEGNGEGNGTGYDDTQFRREVKQHFDRTNDNLDTINESINSLNDPLNNIDSKLGNIEGLLADGINVNVSGGGAGPGDGNGDLPGDGEGENEGENPPETGILKDSPSEGRSSWYESIYEDGAKTVWDKHAQSFEQSEFKQYLTNFIPQVGGNLAFPQFCLDVGLFNFGCHQVEIPPHVIAFIRLVILITAGFAVRRIIFGG